MVYYLFTARILFESYIIFRIYTFFNDLRELKGNNDKNVIYLFGITGNKIIYYH